MKSAAAEGLELSVRPSAAEAGGSPLDASWWPYRRLGDGLEELAQRAGLHPSNDGAGHEAIGAPPSGRCGAAEVERWVEWAASNIGVEAESVDATVPDLSALLRGAGPAVAPSNDARGPGFFLLLRSRRGGLRLLGPDLRVRRCTFDALRSILCRPCEAPLVPEIARLIDDAAIPVARRAGVRAAMLRERLAGERIGPFWMLRMPASSSFTRQLVRDGIRRKITALFAAFALLYLLEIVGWQVIGDAVLSGNLDRGWFAAWLLLMISLVPLRLVGRWLEAEGALVVGRLMKARLMVGALRMDLEGVRRQGAGQLLARVIESQALEALALNGGMAGLTSVIELGFAAWLLSIGAGGPGHVALLLAMLVCIVGLSWRYHGHLRRWTATRSAMTSDLVERMVGHRTCLAQERAGRRDAREDQDMKSYLTQSGAMDHALAPVLAGGPASWLVVGLAGLVPAFASGHATTGSLAIGLGGVLIAQRALGSFAGGLAALARAGVAWRQVRPLFRAGYGGAPQRPFVRSVTAGDRKSANVVEASGLSFAYRPGRDVLAAADLEIRRGERLLVEGASGGGKSTLASLLTGLRMPSSGLLLLNGVDRHTLGDEWHRFATAAPQFHENHVLSGTFAFNLLMGRRWPAPDSDLREAEALCIELGLGDLLRRMPAGLMQRVGETGWQLSHGERSRLFLARALLQDADLTIMDESFAALDPETLEQCLHCSIRRASTLVVIAHP